jgi:hypothetical protein
MEISAARVILAVGKGRALLQSLFEIPTSEMLAEIEVASRRCLVAFLPHPSGWERGPRSLGGLYSPADLRRLRNAVAYGLEDETNQ